MDRKIRVSAYSGGKVDERPLTLYIDAKTIEVEVMEKWVSEDFNTGKRRSYFRLRDPEGLEYLVYQEDETDDWFLRM